MNDITEGVAPTRDLALDVGEARAALGDGGGQAEPAARFELFHAAASICSQKVRAVLAHHGLPYVGHELNIFLGQTYLPGYVRLRMRGCDSYGGALVARHSGSTATAAGGCDGAVVPTLVDWRDGSVIVDSRLICLHLDAQAPAERRLNPPDLADAVAQELEVVDHLPNYQMLMGRPVADGEAAVTRDGVGGALSRKKVAWCDQHMAAHAGDASLVAAYTAKRAKELSAADALFSAEAMSAAYARVETALRALEDRLARRRGRWLHRDDPDMSDLFWGVELLRMRNVGVAHYWEGGRLPQVAAYLAQTEAMPAIQAAVVAWPGALF